MAERRDIRYVLGAENNTGPAFSALRRDLSAVSNSSGAALGALRTLGATAIGAAVVESVRRAGGAFRQLTEDLDALNDASDATGVTVEALSGLEDVARRNGGSLDLVTTAILKLNKALADAKPGSEQEDALRRIGLSARELRALSPEEALTRVAVALQGYANEGEKSRLMQELLGKSLKDIAPFLKDVAEFGARNATVTREQAEEAERFNKQLNTLMTEASNAARSIVGDLLPAANEMISAWREAKEKGDLLNHTLRTMSDFRFFKDVLKGMFPEKTEIDLLKESIEQFEIAQQLNPSDADNNRQLAEAKARLAVVKETVAEEARLRSRPTGDLAFGRISQPRIAAPPPKATEARLSEAERYLETLQKQGEKLMELTHVQQALKDMEMNRLKGLTPVLRQQILDEATRLDTSERINKEKEKELGMQKLLADLDSKRRQAALNLLESTTGNQIEKAADDIDKLRELMKDPAFQTPDAANKIIEAIEKIKEGVESVPPVVVKARTELERLSDGVALGMDRAAESLIDFAVDGRGSLDELFRQFRRDVLRELITDPVRDTMKDAVAEIRRAIQGLDGANNPFKTLFDNLLSGIGGGLSGLFGLFGGGGGGGIGSRANGGPVKAGAVLRVNENGTETLMMGQDGYVLGAGQAGRGAGGQVVYAPVTNLNVAAEVSAQTVQALEALIKRNNARQLRSMRTGGAWAGA